MNRILIAGATGGLGQCVLNELKNRGYFVRAMAIDEKEAESIRHIADEVVVCDATKPETLKDLCNNIDVVFSALGKSVSLFAPDDQTFDEVDYTANKNIIDEAKKAGVKRIVYISIYGSDVYGKFELARVHRKVEKEIFASGMVYSIIRPVGLFSGLLDVLKMAKKGVVVTPGDGENKTNPMHEDDLAIVCADNIDDGIQLIEAGGPRIYTRNEIAELAIKAAGSGEHIHLPEILVKGSLPLLKIYNESFFDKLAFFNNVLTHDEVAPKFGIRNLEDYFIEMKDKVDADLADILK